MTCRMSFLVHCHSKFRYGFWPKEQASISFLRRKMTHHGCSHFNIVLEQEMLAVGDEEQWQGDDWLCCVLIQYESNCICSIFLFVINAPGVSRLRILPVCEPWDSGLVGWLNDWSIF